MSSNSNTATDRNYQPIGAFPGPITSAAAHLNHQRRMSLSSGSGSPPRMQTNFFRRGSVSSVSSASSMADESAIDDSEPASGSPTSPFVRRMSWGAKALREVRIPGASRVPPSPGASSPVVSKGFWQDNKGPIYPNEPAYKQRRASMPAPPNTAMSTGQKEMSIDPMQERMLRNELCMD